MLFTSETGVSEILGVSLVHAVNNNTQTSHMAKTELKRRKIKHQAQEVSKSLFFDRKALLKTEE
ncbi:MAG: hypothetical protein LBS21_04870, partial [Clostridiales bacterium]|nr:hypothetical protein [Clostridiales bacterium]